MHLTQFLFLNPKGYFKFHKVLNTLMPFGVFIKEPPKGIWLGANPSLPGDGWRSSEDPRTYLVLIASCCCNLGKIFVTTSKNNKNKKSKVQVYCVKKVKESNCGMLIFSFCVSAANFPCDFSAPTYVGCGRHFKFTYPQTVLLLNLYIYLMKLPRLR